MRLPALLLVVGLLAPAVGCGESGPGEVAPDSRQEEDAELQELRAEHEKVRTALEKLRFEMERFRRRPEQGPVLDPEWEAEFERRIRLLRTDGIRPLPRAVPHVTGLVAEADGDRNTVEVTIREGGRDLSVGDMITVYRGDEYVGKLVIDEMRGNTVTGHMVPAQSMTSPRKGDRVLAWR